MKCYHVAIASLLMLKYGIVESHVVDLHLSTPEEHAMMEQVDKERENDQALETINNDNSSFHEKLEAIETLIKNEELVYGNTHANKNDMELEV